MKRNGILIGLCVIVAGLIGACGGSVDEDNNGVGGTGGTAGTGGTGSAGTEAGGTAGSGSGGVAGTSASDDLSGTWDVLATPMGDITVAGTLVLDDSQLTVSTDDFSFDFRAGDSPTLAWRSEGQETPIPVPRRGADVRGDGRFHWTLGEAGTSARATGAAT